MEQNVKYYEYCQVLRCVEWQMTNEWLNKSKCHSEIGTIRDGGVIYYYAFTAILWEERKRNITSFIGNIIGMCLFQLPMM